MVCRYSEGSARYEDDDSYDNEKAETATSGDDTQSESVPERKRRRSKVQVSGYTTGEENSENESLSGKFIYFTFFPKGSLSLKSPIYLLFQKLSVFCARQCCRREGGLSVGYSYKAGLATQRIVDPG